MSAAVLVAPHSTTLELIVVQPSPPSSPATERLCSRIRSMPLASDATMSLFSVTVDVTVTTVASRVTMALASAGAGSARARSVA